MDNFWSHPAIIACAVFTACGLVSLLVLGYLTLKRRKRNPTHKGTRPTPPPGRYLSG